MKPRDFTISLTLTAWIALQGAAIAQSPALLDSYARVTTLLTYMTTYVGETLLACVEKNVLTEEQGEAHFKAYRERNATLLERAESWSQQAEQRLRAQGEERAAQIVAEDASLTAMAAASARAQSVIGKAGDTRAACTVIMAAIESGRYDLSGNAEFVELLKTKP
jgi:hypothetical protein